MKYKKKGRLFTRELGTMERIKYLWDQYVNTYHEYPKEIVMTKKEVEEIYEHSRFTYEMVWDITDTPKNKRFYTYKGVKVIIDN